MRTNCGGSYSPWSGSISFTTACVASVVPFLESLDGAALPQCWVTTSSNPTAATGVWKFTGNPDYDNGNDRDPGTFAWVDGSDPSNINDVTLLSPNINLTGLTAPQLVFDYFSNNQGTYANNIFKVDIFNGTTWVNLYTNNTNSANWRVIEIPLVAYAGTTVQLRFVVDKTAATPAGNAYLNDIVLDNISIEQMPSCVKPTNLALTAPSHNTINLSWTAAFTTPSAGYEYYFSDSDIPPGSSTPGTDVPTGLTASITTATGNTTYYVYVRSDCGSGSYSGWTQAAVITTPCAAFASNFLEEFGTGVIPDCWSTTSSIPTGTGLWKFAGNPDYDNGNTSDPDTFAWVDGSDPSNIADVTLMSPLINLAGLTVPEIVFDYFSNNQGTFANNIFKVDIYNGTTWTNIYTNNTNLNQWRTISIPLPSYAGMTVRFRFVVDKTAATPAGNAYLNDIVLDNVMIHEAPVCIAPTGVNLTAVTKFGATVNWTASAIAPSNNYDIYFSTDSTAPGTATAPNGGTAVSTGTALGSLLPSTAYYVWVRGNCGSASSAWSPLASFTTLCDYPTITSANGGSACGQGAITLTGTPSAGQLYWWSAETGGNYLGSGNSYVTPVITATTNYYVAAASVTPNSAVVIGSGTQTSSTSGNSPYYHGYGGNKTQYIIRAAELHAAGIAPGPINSLTYTITELGTTDTFADFAVSIGATTQNAATTTHVGGLTPVYYNSSQSLVEGDNTYAFSAPFMWDGTSNIVVQTCYSNNNYGGGSSYVAYNTTSFAAATYTYADNQTAEDICGTATGAVGGSGGTYTSSVRPNIIFNASALCSSPRQMVTATISTADAIDADAAQASICAGASTNLSVASTNANYTYVWMPGNLTGPAQTVTPATTTTYTVTATDSSTNCVTAADVIVTVNALPPAITVSPAAAQSCAGTPVMLSATGATVSGNAVLGTGTTAPGTTDFPNPFSAFYGGTKTQMLYTSAELLTQGLIAGSSVTAISFDFFASADYALNDMKIRIGSTTNANTTAGFVPLSSLTTVYSGTYTPVDEATGLVSFTFTTPYVWDGQNIIVEIVHNQGNSGNGSGTRTTTTATIFDSVYTLAKDGVTPAGAASFDALTPATWVTGGTYTAVASKNRPNAVFAHSLNLPVTWSPSAGLYTDAAGTVAYAGQAATTVYAMPASAATYTATATNLATCIAIDDVVVTPNGPNTPTGSTSQTIIAETAVDATIEDIVVAETGVIWYATLANAIAAVNPLAAGTQIVSGTTYYGTLPTGSCVPLAVTVDVALSTKGFDASRFSYYPNPVKDVLNITYANDITSVRIFNLLGQEVISKEINATEASIDMSQLADGPYVVNVNAAGNVKTIKVIKKQ